MRKKCERCGKELRFFEQALKSENQKLGLSYTNICGDCHRTVSAAVKAAENLNHEIGVNLEKVYGTNAAEAEPDQLVLLAADALFRLVPDWHNPNSPIASILVMQDTVLPNRKEYLDILIYKILRIDYTGALGRYGIDSMDGFLLYMAKFTRYLEQIGANYGERGRKRYTDIFISRAGIAVVASGTEVSVIPLHKDELYGCEEDDTGVTYDVTVKNLCWPDSQRRVRFCFTREENARGLAEFLDACDQVKADRVQKKLNLLLEKVNRQAEKDITAFVPGKNLGDIDIDQILLGVMRALIEQDTGAMFDGKEPEGLLKLVLERYYLTNMKHSDYSDYESLNHHIQKDCLLMDGLIVSDSGGPESQAWGLFTPKGYIISRFTVPAPFHAVADDAVNDLYAHTRDIVLNGKELFFIDLGGMDSGIGTLKGITIRTEKPGRIQAVKKYFGRRSRVYLQQENRKLQDRVKHDYRVPKAARASAEQFFVGFGLLPFCLRDEHLRIETLLRENDVLMQSLIPAPEKEPKENSGYAGKLVHEFRRSADSLAEELDVPEAPPARALLWEELQKCVRAEAVAEWKRLGGDIVNDKTDNLLTAIDKYAALPDIDNESAYTLGLFTMYLMNKGIFKDLDFVRAYDNAAEAYRAVCPERPAPEVPETAQKGAFDVETPVPEKSGDTQTKSDEIAGSSRDQKDKTEETTGESEMKPDGAGEDATASENQPDDACETASDSGNSPEGDAKTNGTAEDQHAEDHQMESDKTGTDSGSVNVSPWSTARSNAANPKTGKAADQDS
ncbi:MAG: hypothetical protein ACOYB8_02715 [Eubacteriaceae bacterium]